MIPLMLDLSGRTVRIFGGGGVGARKAAFFAGEAAVQVFSRSFSSRFSTLPVTTEILDVEHLDDKALGDLIRGAFLVVAATSSHDQNDRIGRICRELGVLFNNADGEGDLMLPAVVRGEQYLIAVSTRGSSPAVARFVRETIERELPSLDRMVLLQREIRAALRQLSLSSDERRHILSAILRDPAVNCALNSGVDEAAAVVQARYLQVRSPDGC
ncbi:precorrin-2 dehydrogenase/sirohydrochlorin ferrochelatase family protein [Methanosphaerula subterraneus]|uniref:precorrin-2 dehydrogenase/sirohydrochlorin ferrochelatase family protein n=1 Tax=Methanosphaerula subterraneus TaxID=3350244 RepID=UPI003F86EA94